MEIKHIESARGQRLVALLFAAFLLFSGGATLAQEWPMGEKEVRALVEKALPQWDAEVLKVPDKDQWSRTLDFDTVFKAVGDDKPIPVEKLPNGAKRLADQDKVVRLNSEIGKIRYINRARTWKFEEKTPSKGVEVEKAREVVLKATADLGIPRDEMAELHVATQVAGAAPVGSNMIKYEYEMYRIVTVPRILNKLPVYGSSFRTAVSNKAQIQRLQVNWPPFRLSPNLFLRIRDAVVREAVNEIMTQRPTPPIKIQAYLAYTPRSLDDEEIWFVPAAIISIYSEPTPYQLVVPLAVAKAEK
jgi:hypothetical protein